MKTLEDLTPEIRAKMEVYKRECVEDLYSGKEWRDYDPKNTEIYVDYVYGMAAQIKPVVIIANDPTEYKLYYNLLFNDEFEENKCAKLHENIDRLFNLKNGKPNQAKADDLQNQINRFLQSNKKIVNRDNAIEAKNNFLFVCSEYARVYLMWYYFISKEFDMKLSKNQEHLEWLYEHVKQSSVSRAFFCDKVCLVLRMPSRIIRNNIGFHSVYEPAIQFGPDFSLYYINGRRVDEEIFKNYEAGTLTFEMFQKEQNEDVRASIATLIIEREGHEGFMRFLGARVIASSVIKHAGDYTETIRLFRTSQKYPEAQNSKGDINQPYAWVEFTCPSTGQVYCIPTCPTLNDAVAAAKFCRPSNVPYSLPYVWQSAN